MFGRAASGPLSCVLFILVAWRVRSTMILTDVFYSVGNLRYIRNLKPWPLRRVMVEKYVWSEGDAQALCKFLEPMLVIDHRERARARELVDHPWLEVDPLSEDLWGW